MCIVDFLFLCRNNIFVSRASETVDIPAPPFLMGVVGVGRVGLPAGTSKESIKKLAAAPAALDDSRQLL